MRAVSATKKQREPWIVSIILVALLPLFPEYFAPFLSIGALVAAYQDAKRQSRSFTVGPLGKIMLVYLLFLAFGILYSRNASSAFFSWVMWGSMLTSYVALHTVLTSRQRMDTALLGISAAAGGVGAIACIQYFIRIFFGFSGHLQIWYPLDSLLYRLSPLAVNLEVTGDRACSTFTNPNILSQYLVMAIPFVALYAFGGKRDKTRLFSRVCLMLAVSGVAFSFSRGSYLAVLAIAAVFALANVRRIKLVVLAAFSTAVLTPPAVLERLFSIQKTKDSAPPLGSALDAAGMLITAPGADKAISERFQIWYLCLQSFLEHPLVGIGSGVENTAAMLLAGSVNAPHAHNIVLQLLVEGGIFGLGIFLFAGFKALQTGVRLTRKTGEARHIGVTSLAFMAGFCVNSMVEYPFFTPKLIGMFLLVLALADSAGRLYLEQTESPLADVVMPPVSLHHADSVAPAHIKFTK